GVAATLGRFEAAVFEAPLEQLATDLTPGRASPPGRLWAQLTNGTYRQARTTALAWWRSSPEPGPAELSEAVAAASAQLSAWRQAARDGGGPRLTAELAATEGAFSQLHQEMTDLARWACLPDFGELSLTEFLTRVQALLADTETLYRLPELARLRGSLRDQGLWPLVEEISLRHLTTDD